MSLCDADARVAEDVLRERFSPAKPYRYEWFVAVNRSGRKLRARLSAIDPARGELLRFEEHLPPLDQLEAWAAQAASMFGVIELQMEGRARTAHLPCRARLHVAQRCELYHDHPGPHRHGDLSWS